MGSAPSSRSEQWEREVIKGRGLGEGSGNIVRQNTDEQIADEEEKKKAKKTHDIVRRHSMLKAQLAQRAYEQEQADLEEERKEKEAAEVAAAAAAADDRQPMNATDKKESFGASQHAKLLQSLHQDEGDDSATKSQDGTKVHDFGEMKAEIQVDSTSDTAFSAEDPEDEANVLRECFESVLRKLGLEEGQFEVKLANTKVVAAISTSASAPSDAASQSTENDSKKEVPPSKSNGFAFGLVVRFFIEEPGFSAKCIEHMCTFLGFHHKEGSSDEWEETPRPGGPICDEFSSLATNRTPACGVRLAAVSKATLKLE